MTDKTVEPAGETPVNQPKAKSRPGKIATHTAVRTSGSIRPAALDRWNPAIHASVRASNVIEMYDVIGEDMWTGGGITAKSVAKSLKEFGSGNVEIHLNSPGGDMFEGIAIYNLLASHAGSINVKIMGLAASAASIIAMAGDTVEIGDASFLMIHNCWCLVVGNRHDFMETAVYLEPFDRAMAEVYAKRSGQDIGKIEEWMDANSGDGTYFSTQQALDLGFADGKLSAESVKLLPSAALIENKPKTEILRAELALQANMPKSEARALLAKIRGGGDSVAEPQDAGDTWLVEANALLAKMRT